jgi:glycogen debranching enzyme
VNGRLGHPEHLIRRLDHPEVAVHADATVLLTGPDGAIERPEHGLFDADARLLCRYRLTVDGRPPTLIGAAVVDDDGWLATAVVRRRDGRPEGPVLPEDALELLVDRRVGPGLAERITITNRGATQVSHRIEIELASDLIDLLEFGRAGVSPEPVTPTWDREPATLSFARTVEGPRATVTRAAQVRATAPGPVTWDGQRLSIGVELEGGAGTTIEIDVQGSRDGSTVDAPARDASRRRAAERAAWRSDRVHVRTEPPLLGDIVERAIEDMFALRSRDLERSPGHWVLNAGIPRFTGLFGRDALTAGWQSSLAGPEALLGAIDAIAATQVDRDDPFRDAEPGKLVHEQRRGPLAASGRSPRDAYYGSDTVPAMFLLALTEAWHWTGDDGLLERHLDVAERAIGWAMSRLERDGFLRYETRSPEGLRNQGWKDSDEAIRFPDGTLVPVPIATVEEQAFLLLGLERLAEVHIALGRDAEARSELEQAAMVRHRWQEAFWREDLGFYALALDPQDRPVDSVTSNPGHALGTGIVPPELAGRVGARLLEPDLFSGFGVRTLSAEHPSFNPFAYHLGSVWPVEQATFLLGAKRYGLDDVVDRLAEALVAAAAGSPGRRLPEAIAGLDRASWPVPVPYPGASPLQAWSASATIQLLQSLVGIYPFAPARVLALARPRLPSWVDMIRIDGLRVGDARVSLQFERRADGSASHAVTDRDGTLIVVEAPPPQATELGLVERAMSWGLEHAPGTLSRALRVAMGIETIADQPAATAGETR